MLATCITRFTIKRRRILPTQCIYTPYKDSQYKASLFSRSAITGWPLYCRHGMFSVRHRNI